MGLLPYSNSSRGVLVSFLFFPLATPGCVIAYSCVWHSTGIFPMLIVKGGNMNFSEKLYSLRKKNGLSQEQLAEGLGVSRQAISKWESGHAVPETEKLLVISEYFEVSLDYLMKDSTVKEHKKNEISQTDNRTANLLPGAIICIAGVICLVIWGLLSLFNPTASAQLSESSMIQLDGNGIFLLLCLAAIIIGAVLLLKNAGQK